MRKILWLTLLVFALGLILSGCGGAPKKAVGQEKVIEKSADKKPDWITVPQFEQDKKLFFSGGVTGRASYSLGLRQAKAESIKNVAEGIQVRVRTEFTSAIRGSNVSEEDLGEFVQDSIAMVTENLKIQGLTPEENYYEKIERITTTGVEYKYNCYSLIALKVEDYNLARDIALNGMKKKAKKEANKKAEETATLLLEKLSGQVEE